MGKVIPKRCPNCGSKSIRVQELESPHDLAELYDVFCRDCKWSGDVSPDLPLLNSLPLDCDKPARDS